MNTCPNEKCQGRLLYQGTSSVNGAFIDWYKCLKCLTVHTAEADHAAPLLTGDEDTEPIAVRDEVQS